MQVSIPITFAPDPATLIDDVSIIPASRGIYALTTLANPPHISWSINLKRRLNRLLVSSYTASSGDLTTFAQKVTSVSYWPVSSRLESSLILYQLTRESYPDTYLRRLHLRMPWFIGLTQTDSFARLQISNRLSGLKTLRYGPFRTREEAEVYQEQIHGLYQLRRCPDTLHPSPDHPGCIYGEMNQCLRPCQCVVSSQEYATESARVSGFLATAGMSDLKYLAVTRDRAASDLDFEQAALAHKRIEKLQAAISTRDKVVAGIQNFHGVALTAASAPDSVNLWPMYAGYWQTPLLLELRQETRSLDSMLRERLYAAFESPTASGSRLEQMALFSRWYYSSWRDGHWFPFETLQQINYRRLVKAMANLVLARQSDR